MSAVELDRHFLSHLRTYLKPQILELTTAKRPRDCLEIQLLMQNRIASLVEKVVSEIILAGFETGTIELGDDLCPVSKQP